MPRVPPDLAPGPCRMGPLSGRHAGLLSRAHAMYPRFMPRLGVVIPRADRPAVGVQWRRVRRPVMLEPLPRLLRLQVRVWLTNARYGGGKGSGQGHACSRHRRVPWASRGAPAGRRPRGPPRRPPRSGRAAPRSRWPAVHGGMPRVRPAGGGRARSRRRPPPPRPPAGGRHRPSAPTRAGPSGRCLAAPRPPAVSGPRPHALR